MGQQRGDARADEVDRGDVAGDQQQEHHGDQLVLAQPLFRIAGGDETAEQVVAGVRPFGVDEPGHIGAHVLPRLVHHGGIRWFRSPPEHLVGPVLEVAALVHRDPEQFADHRDREREREVRNQVGVAGRDDCVQQTVGDGLDSWPHPRHAAGGERLGDQAAQTGVVGRVAAEHVAQHRVAFRFGQLPQDPAVRGIAYVAAEAGVGQGRESVLVARDEPGVQAARDDDAAHGAVLAQLPVQGERIRDEGGVGVRQKGRLLLTHEASRSVSSSL